MRFVSGPCSETQARASSTSARGGGVRMVSGAGRYPPRRRAVPAAEQNGLGGAAGEVWACGPPSVPDGPFPGRPCALRAAWLPPVIRRKSDLVRSGRYIAARATMTDSATTITPKPNGPLLVQGPVRILAPDGTELAVPPRKDGRPAEVVVLCRCGGSATKPFCDGTHKRIAFCDTPPAPPPPPPPQTPPPNHSPQIFFCGARGGGPPPLY